MKKVLVLMAACATMVACQQKGKADAEAKAGDTAQTEVAADTMHYEGVVAAADGPGIRYEIALAADSTNGFSMKETYLDNKDKDKERDKKEEREDRENRERRKRCKEGSLQVCYW